MSTPFLRSGLPLPLSSFFFPTEPQCIQKESQRQKLEFINSHRFHLSPGQEKPFYNTHSLLERPFLLHGMPVPWGVAPRVNLSGTGLGLPACRHGSDQRLVLTPLTHGSHTPLLRAVLCSSSPALDARDASSIWLLKTSTSPDGARRPQGTNPRVAEAPGGLVKAQRRARQSAQLAHSQQRWSGDHAWRTTVQTVEGPVMEPRVPLKLLSHCSRGVNR